MDIFVTLPLRANFKASHDRGTLKGSIMFFGRKKHSAMCLYIFHHFSDQKVFKQTKGWAPTLNGILPLPWEEWIPKCSMLISSIIRKNLLHENNLLSLEPPYFPFTEQSLVIDDDSHTTGIARCILPAKISRFSTDLNTERTFNDDVNFPHREPNSERSRGVL